MADTTSETTYFGLTQVGEGESFSKNGWAFSTSDRQKLDTLLEAALYHTHTGDPALGDPTDPPTMVAQPTGGNLPSATTFYYRASFVDQWGLETSASPEGSVTTPNPISPPTAPSANVETSSGTVGPGVYSYLVTFTDNYGGESTPSGLGSAQVLTGTSNRIRLDLAAFPTGATGYHVYRSRPGQTSFYYLGAATSATYYDSGQVEDQSVTAPSTNTTNSQNSIQVTIPANFIPEGCFGWKIYRALASGNYDGDSMVHWVTEGISDTDTTPRLTWTDVGDALEPGTPPDVNSSAPSGVQLSYAALQGVLPLAAMPRGAQVLSAFTPGNVTDQETVTVTEVPMPLQPTRFTAFFKTPPSAGSTVRFRFLDSHTPTANYVELSCPSTPSGSDPAGYYHVEFPLYIAESFEAETGTRSNTTSVAIASDLAASSGQAVALVSQNDYVQMDLGVLDPGLYSTFFTARALQFASSSTNDLRVQVLRVDTGAVVSSAVSYTLVAGTGANDTTLYSERNGPVFTAPGGVDLVLRVSKVTATSQAYNVDQARFLATVPTLQPGVITAKAFVDSGPTSAADVNLALWF